MIELSLFLTIAANVLIVLFSTMPKSLRPSMLRRGPVYLKSRVSHSISTDKTLSKLSVVLSSVAKYSPLICIEA